MASKSSNALRKEIDPSYPVGDRDTFVVQRETASWGKNDLPLTTYDVCRVHTGDCCEDEEGNSCKKGSPGETVIECDDRATAERICKLLNSVSCRTQRC